MKALLNQSLDDRLLQKAITLLNQQCWCWGRDILRPEGNWLVEIGFTRLEPPPEFKESSSVYQMSLPNDCLVVLRGFGVFFGQAPLGSVFLHRFEFLPQFSRTSAPSCPAWTDEQLPETELPGDCNRNERGLLLLKLIDWIQQYEINVERRLGLGYRRQTLAKWNDGKRLVIPAESIAAQWRRLSIEIAGHYR